MFFSKTVSKWLSVSIHSADNLDPSQDHCFNVSLLLVVQAQRELKKIEYDESANTISVHHAVYTFRNVAPRSVGQSLASLCCRSGHRFPAARTRPLDTTCLVDMPRSPVRRGHTCAVDLWLRESHGPKREMTRVRSTVPVTWWSQENQSIFLHPMTSMTHVLQGAEACANELGLTRRS